MLKWLRMPGRQRDREIADQSPGVKPDDSGEDEYETRKEESLEADPSGMTRIKTDEI